MGTCNYKSKVFWLSWLSQSLFSLFVIKCPLYIQYYWSDFVASDFILEEKNSEEIEKFNRYMI